MCKGEWGLRFQVFLGCAGALAVMTVLSTALGAVAPELV